MSYVSRSDHSGLTYNPDFQKESWHLWAELGTAKKAINILSQKWDMPKLTANTVRVAAHFFALQNIDYVRDYLRMQGEKFSDDLFERVMVERAIHVIYFGRTSPYWRLYDFDDWLDKNPWAKKYERLIEKCKSAPARYRTKSKAGAKNISP